MANIGGLGSSPSPGVDGVRALAPRGSLGAADVAGDPLEATQLAAGTVGLVGPVAAAARALGVSRSTVMRHAYPE